MDGRNRYEQRVDNDAFRPTEHRKVEWKCGQFSGGGKMGCGGTHSWEKLLEPYKNEFFRPPKTIEVGVDLVERCSILIFKHTHAHIYTHTYVYIYRHMYIYTYIHTYIYI